MTRRVVEIEKGYSQKSYSTGQGYVNPSPKHVIEEFKPKREPDDGIPLELLPVIRTLKGYGHRIHALGALRGARALERVVEGLLPHIRQFPELVDVVLEAKHEAEAIRAEVNETASGEQQDSDDED